jgi:hypothetical protein
MPNLADFTLTEWTGLIGVILFGSILMWSIASRQGPPGDRPK